MKLADYGSCGSEVVDCGKMKLDFYSVPALAVLDNYKVNTIFIF